MDPKLNSRFVAFRYERYSGLPKRRRRKKRRSSSSRTLFKRKEVIALVDENKKLHRLPPYRRKRWASGTKGWDLYLIEETQYVAAFVLIRISEEGKHSCRVFDVKTSPEKILEWLKENEHVCDSLLESLEKVGLKKENNSVLLMKSYFSL